MKTDPIPKQGRTDFKPGDVITDRYRIIERIAAGGMGVVYEAKDERQEQRVAIKVIRSDQLDHAETHARFNREARAASQLQSEHVARVYDVSSLQGGEPFIVMEYLSGENLNELLAQEGPLDPETAVDFMLQMLRGLAEAHSHGIVHRDLKPSNVFIVESDERRQVKLFDFGISKVMEDSGSNNHLTASQTILGTPANMAPEQVLSSHYVDGRADLWSMGTILYEMLTGTNPFETEAAGSSFSKILQLTIQPPREHNPNVSASLNKIVMKCLERAPETRYQTAGELFDALLPLSSTPVAEQNELLHSLPEPQGAAAKAHNVTDMDRDRSSRRATAQRSLLLAAVPLLIVAVAVAWMLLSSSEMDAASAPSLQTSTSPDNAASRSNAGSVSEK